ncbi:MAG: BAX inhibitor (BI)-1/YccA family protein [Alphaproteobacteria bacterium]|nr:BAX inhibitor (BI)-1/YccA family protein [Alphaproteobacteria bacterium]
MSDHYGSARSVPTGRADMAVDAGLRSFMLGVYSKMGLGLVLSAVLAYAVGAYAPITQLVLGTPFVYVVQWGPVALLFGSMFFMRNPSPTGSGILYWAVVSLIGMGLGVWVYLAMTGVSASSIGGGMSYNVSFTGIAQAFLVTAIAFGGLSLWGYTTKRDLSPIGSFLMFAVFGLLGLSILNLFLFKSDFLMVAMQAVALLVFGLIIAFQTQSLKYSYYQFQGDTRSLAVMTNYGALNLYIAFIQIFQILLSFFSRE